MHTPSFTDLADLASARVGGRAIATNDDFFAPKSEPGQSRSRRSSSPASTRPAASGWTAGNRAAAGRPGHDWCVVALGMRGVIRGVNVDTSFFTGNYPVALFDRRARQRRGAVTTTLAAAGTDRRGRRSSTEVALQRRSATTSVAIDDGRPWTHLRLNIFPDGGVARLRVYGEVAIDWARVARSGRAVDLASIMNGGLVLGASDMHFGAKDNMIMPGRAKNMGDGWETRRRRGPGYDWAIVRLGAPGVDRADRDRHESLQGQLPGQRVARGHACAGRGPAQALASATWIELLPQTRSCARTTATSLRRSCVATRPGLARAAQHLSGRRRQPPARPWNRGSGLTRPRPGDARELRCARCCGSTRWVDG